MIGKRGSGNRGWSRSVLAAAAALAATAVAAAPLEIAQRPLLLSGVGEAEAAWEDADCGPRTLTASEVRLNASQLESGDRLYRAGYDPSDWSGRLEAYRVDPATGSVAASPAWEAALPEPALRQVFTFNPETGRGVAFRPEAVYWQGLGEQQRQYLGEGDAALGQARLAYLRGEPANEARQGGAFRDRAWPLGAIVNSDPWFVASPNYFYHALEGDYGRFLAGIQGRPRMLYVGASDGMLHGFDADSGEQRFAYLPNAVFPHLAALTAPDYRHRYLVDGAPRSGDAYLDGRWRTVLVGTTGAGGRAVFALDVTNPAAFDADAVLWEFADDDDLGYTLGAATIARFGGRWVALVGNGYNSPSGRAVLFALDLASGRVLQRLDTGAGGPGAPNGLGSPLPVDVSGDRNADYIYAGDLQGNLWRFDAAGNSRRLFTAVGPRGQAQPITARPAAGPHPRGGQMVYFGTGRYFAVGDAHDTAVQSLYGIWDRDGGAVGRTELVAQNITYQGSLGDNGVRTVSDRPVDYSSRRGWYLELIHAGAAEGERVVSAPLLRHGRLTVATLISHPPSDEPCAIGREAGWLLELDAVSGGRLSQATVEVTGDGHYDSVGVPLSGVRRAGYLKTPATLEAGGREYQLIDSGPPIQQLPPARSSLRQAWRELRWDE